MTIGIYAIKNKINGKKYIGSSKNIEQRFQNHLYNLRKNIHGNYYLQNSFNKHGEDSFILEILEITSLDNLLLKEQIYIDLSDKTILYNLGSVGGGDNISQHPNNKQIREKISISSRKTHEKRTPEEKEKIHLLRIGENNGNYGKHWNNDLRKRVSDIVKNRFKDEPYRCENISNHLKIRWQNMSEEDRNKFSERRKEIMLESNPFKGKKHSQDTKNKIKQVHQDNWNKLSLEEKKMKVKHMRAVMIDDKEFYSIAEAARYLKITSTLLLFRIKSKNPKFTGYKFKQQ